MSETLRRTQVSLFTPTERLIWNALKAVEAMPSDVRLTDAIILLQAARASVADFVDGAHYRRYVSEFAESREVVQARERHKPTEGGE